MIQSWPLTDKSNRSHLRGPIALSPVCLCVSLEARLSRKMLRNANTLSLHVVDLMYFKRVANGFLKGLQVLFECDEEFSFEISLRCLNSKVMDTGSLVE